MNSDIEREFRNDQGLSVRLRPLRPDDVPCLISLFEHMGPESRYRRFNIPLVEPDPDWVEQQATALATIEPAEGMGWIAIADLPGETRSCVGGARYIIADEDTAEMSVSVRDDLQGTGIGTALLQHAARHAHQRGIRTVRGYIQSANVALWRLLRRLDVPLQVRSEGTYMVVELALEEALDTLEQRASTRGDLTAVTPNTPQKSGDGGSEKQRPTLC